MKRLILILITVLFVSCTRTVYVDSETGKEVDPIPQRYASDFINLERVGCKYSNFRAATYNIAVDLNTDVLYVWFDDGFSPIMKPDGTCLSYTEWKERNK